MAPGAAPTADRLRYHAPPAPEATAVTRRYRFADCELLPVAPYLRRGGRDVAVSSQVVSLLRCLVERAGEVVPRAELLERVWGHDHLTDAAFARAVMRTRKAIGDDGQEQRLIRTVHGRGLVFAAPVEVVEGPFEPVASTTPARRARWPLAALALLGALAVALALVLRAGPEQAAGELEGPRERLLVLATLDHPADDEELAALAQAMPGLLADGLGVLGIRMLHAAEHADAADDNEWRTLGSRFGGVFGARSSLALALARAPGGLEATVVVVGAGAGATRLVRPDAVALARSLRQHLAVRLTGLAPERVDAAAGADPMLDSLLLRARSAHARGQREQALQALDAAIALAPDQARLQLLRLEIALADGTPPADLADHLREAVAQAGEGMDALARAMVLQRAGVHAWYGGDAATAASLLSEALVLALASGAPLTGALSRNALSMAQQSLGEADAAWENARIAVETLRDAGHPYHLSMALTNLGYLAEDRGRLDSALRWHREALELRREFGFERLLAASRYALARVARRTGALDEAAALAGDAAAAMAAAGQQMEQVSALEELAVIDLLRGRHEAAAGWLAQARALARPLDDRLGLAWLDDVEGRLRLAEGRVAEAVALLRTSARAQESEGERHEARYTRIALLDALRRLDGPTAEELAEAARLETMLLAEADGFTHDQRTALVVVRLRHARRSGDDGAAGTACEQALDMARTSGASDLEAEAAVECGLLRLAAGDREAAGRMLALARGWNGGWAGAEPLARGIAAQDP